MQGLADGSRHSPQRVPFEIGALLSTGLRLAGAVPQLSRYAVVSAVALALDFAVFLALTAMAMRPSLAGVIGYAAGMGLHYLLSVRFVFDARATDKAPARLFGEFALTGISGMAVTALVIAAATSVAGTPALAAKILAAGASFLLVFALRRCVVFARGAARGRAVGDRGAAF